MTDRPTLKILANTDNAVKLMYDTPKSGTNEYGNWYLYGVEKDGEEMGLFATENLNEKLSPYTAGDVVNIRKDEYEPGKFGFNVIPQEGTPPRTQSNDRSEVTATTVEKREYFESKDDKRTSDIHRSLAFKEACMLYAKSVDMADDAVLKDGDLETIATNAQNLLKVLEGFESDILRSIKDDLPF